MTALNGLLKVAPIFKKKITENCFIIKTMGQMTNITLKKVPHSPNFYHFV